MWNQIWQFLGAQKLQFWSFWRHKGTELWFLRKFQIRKIQNSLVWRCWKVEKIAVFETLKLPHFTKILSGRKIFKIPHCVHLPWIDSTVFCLNSEMWLCWRNNFSKLVSCAKALAATFLIPQCDKSRLTNCGIISKALASTFWRGLWSKWRTRRYGISVREEKYVIKQLTTCKKRTEIAKKWEHWVLCSRNFQNVKIILTTLRFYLKSNLGEFKWSKKDIFGKFWGSEILILVHTYEQFFKFQIYQKSKFRVSNIVKKAIFDIQILPKLISHKIEWH